MRDGGILTLFADIFVPELGTLADEPGHQLIAWRVLVGFGMGGEWSCGSVLVAETWPAKHRAKAMGIMQSGWAIGALIAAALSGLVLERFGWRILFLIGAAPAVVAFFIRRSVEEPPIWREREKHDPSKW